MINARALRRSVVCGIFVASVATSAGAAGSTKDQIVRCKKPDSQFDTLVCANPGVLDRLNHFHQMINYADPSPAQAKLRQDMDRWFGALRRKCAPLDVPDQVKCIQDAVYDNDFLARFDGPSAALYAGASDIDENECDGCDAPTSNEVQKPAPQPDVIADPSPANPSPKAKAEPKSLRMCLNL